MFTQLMYEVQRVFITEINKINEQFPGAYASELE